MGRSKHTQGCVGMEGEYVGSPCQLTGGGGRSGAVLVRMLAMITEAASATAVDLWSPAGLLPH